MRFRRSGLLAVHPQAFFTLDMYEQPLVFEAPFTREGPAAVVTIRGMLTHHKESPSLDSYDDIQSRVQCALDSDASVIALRIDSLGGDVSGCFDLAKWIEHAAAKCGKRVLAYVDGHAASAAYALACAAESISVSLTGFVGSIGVINAICDQSAADAMMGVRFVFATSGARKGDGNPHIPVSDDTISHLQSQVNDLAMVFYGHVANRRGLSIETIAGFEAGLFFGSGAVATRLADNVCSFAEMVSAASESPQPKVTTVPKYLEQMKELAVKMAVDGDDDEKASAKKMLAALEPEEGGEKPAPADKAEGEDKDAESKSAAAKAAADDEKKEADAKAASAEKAAAAATTFELSRDLHALKAKLAAKEDAETRSALFATRPDFDDKTRALMATWPVSQVKAACETFPKIITHPAAAAFAMGTRGDRLTDTGISKEDADVIRSKMYGQNPTPGVHMNGNDLVFENMSREQAQAILAKKGAQ